MLGCTGSGTGTGLALQSFEWIEYMLLYASILAKKLTFRERINLSLIASISVDTTRRFIYTKYLGEHAPCR